MKTITRKALLGAQKWLTGQQRPGMALEACVERLFGISCCLAPSLNNRRVLRDHFGQLEQFSWFQYHGDPICALALCRVLKAADLHHASLDAFINGLCTVLKSAGTAVEGKFALICDLLRANGVEPPQVRVGTFSPPELAGLVKATRSELIEMCRMVTLVTSCGSRETDTGELRLILPHMAFSYARDWDLECTCALLRACAFLNVSKSPAAQWASEWLLDQQQPDGRFGLADSADWLWYFNSTVNAVWTIAELDCPGFFLKDATLKEVPSWVPAGLGAVTCSSVVS